MTAPPAQPRRRSIQPGAGPVDPLAHTALRPLPLRAVRFHAGFFADLQSRNAELSVPLGAAKLEEMGAWLNFSNAATAQVTGYHGPCFEDGEAYKWLEAVAWEAGRTGGSDLAGWLDVHTAEIAAAQAADGYIGTFVQLGQRSERYAHLDFDHEIFNMGALLQSAVAQFRSTGRTELLDVATRAADHLVAQFGTGPGQREGFCGHPVAELGLVELYRTLGETKYLDLASYFVEARGRSLLAPDDARRAAYLSDRIPVRQTKVPEGHAVRAVYLAAGATDVAIENEDQLLLELLESQWEQMVTTKMYVSGGLGSRWEGEAFGNPYELPSDAAYAETCAAIASLQWNWRLLLATGRARYAEAFEWQLYNAVLPGVSLDRQTYFYVNALQVRSGSDDPDERAPSGGRRPWFGASCCPTNLMRTLASLHHYVATADESGIQIHQFAAGVISADRDDTESDGAESGDVGFAVEVATDYPRAGEVRIIVTRAPERVATIAVRIPSWGSGATANVSGEVLQATPGSYLRCQRRWQVGDVLTVDIPLQPRLIYGNPRVESARAAAAIARGPVLYAVEQVDHPDGVMVDDLALTSTRLSEIRDGQELDHFPMIQADGAVVNGGDSLYSNRPAATGATTTIRAVPYFQWGNRGIGAMKVWLPVS